jgi:hypothetical protein
VGLDGAGGAACRACLRKGVQLPGALSVCRRTCSPHHAYCVLPSAPPSPPSASAASQLGDVSRLVPNPLEGGAALPVSAYVAGAFGIRKGGPGVFPGEWGALGMLGALGAAYFAASYIGLRFLRYQKR